MGCNASKVLQQVAPSLPSIPTNPEVLLLLGQFNTQYPELKQVLVSSNNLSQDQKLQFNQELSQFLSKVPVPTVPQLYTFTLQEIAKYNINIQPTDDEVNSLMTAYNTKYSYMSQYSSAVTSLSSDQQMEANVTVKNFLNTYPLGSVDDFFKLQIQILKKYNLPLPPDVSFDSSGNMIQGFQNNNIYKNYSKISMNMELYPKKNQLTETVYYKYK